MKPGELVETPQGPGVVVELEWDHAPDEHGRLRDRPWIVVRLADGRVRLYPAGNVHTAETSPRGGNTMSEHEQEQPEQAQPEQEQAEPAEQEQAERLADPAVEQQEQGGEDE